MSHLIISPSDQTTAAIPLTCRQKAEITVLIAGIFTASAGFFLFLKGKHLVSAFLMGGGGALSLGLTIDLVRLSRPKEEEKPQTSVKRKLFPDETDPKIADVTRKSEDIDFNTDPYGKKSIFFDVGFNDFPDVMKNVRQAVEESLLNGYEGRVHAEIGGNLLRLCLFVGMIPVDREVNYVMTMYGTLGQKALAAYPFIREKLENKIPLTTVECSRLEYIKEMILGNELTVDAESITDQQVIDNKELLAGLLQRPGSYITLVLIPSLLEGKRDFEETFRMVLSDEGIQRWRDHIGSHQGFEFFDPLGLLRFKMTPEQLKTYNEIRESQEKA